LKNRKARRFEMSNEKMSEKQGDHVIHAPSTYAKLSEPFESFEAMNEAWVAFQTDLRVLRAKHRIRDLTVILEGAFMLDGEPAEARICAHNGSSLRKLPSLAFCYGEAKAEQEDHAGGAGEARGQARAAAVTGFSVFVCGRRERPTCSSHDCGRTSEAKCQHRVKRDGETAQCLRDVCRGCVVVVDAKTYCAAHGRVMKQKLLQPLTRTDSEQ
jgi:hypothetical protein